LHANWSGNVETSNNVPDVSVVVPVYNEVDNVPILVDEIEKALASAGLSFEIVIVDDGSTDGSSECIDSAAAEKGFVRAVHFDGNYGQTSAFDAGIKAAAGRAICMIDADLQNDPADIPRLVTELETHDAAVGWRADRKDPWTKKLTSRVANFIRKRSTGDYIHDTGCALKAFRADVVKRVKLFNGMHRFFTTLAKMDGADIVEVKVNHRPRRFGKSKYSIFNRAIRPTLDLLAVMWMQRRNLRYRVRRSKGPEQD
jgi:glycosyltransferase involved in cell wall biosynthesis